jgi:hypothetical protein
MKICEHSEDKYRFDASIANLEAVAKQPKYEGKSSVACLPGSATANLESERVVPMQTLRVGDTVRSSAAAYTKLPLFTYADDIIATECMKFHSDSFESCRIRCR